MAFIELLHETKYNIMKEVHVHPWYELYYLRKGRTRYLIGNEIYSVSEGNLVFVPKGQYHMTDSGCPGLVERCLLSFDDALFDSDTSVLLDEFMRERLITVPINRLEGLESLFEKMERSLSFNDAIGGAVMKINALAILSYVCRHKRASTHSVSEADRIVHDVAEYISSHYRDDLTLALLSRRFSVSEPHLSRRFKEVAGIGLNEYVTHVRIMNAERLLRSGMTSITAVAEECGFNDSNYFSTVFKKIKGITPLKFAKGEEG